MRLPAGQLLKEQTLANNQRSHEEVLKDFKTKFKICNMQQVSNSTNYPPLDQMAAYHQSSTYNQVSAYQVQPHQQTHQHYQQQAGGASVSQHQFGHYQAPTQLQHEPVQFSAYQSGGLMAPASNQAHQAGNQALSASRTRSPSVGATSSLNQPSVTAAAAASIYNLEATKSTKGASKLRRDLINIEITQLRELLPLPASTRQRLSQLQLMALVLVYVRKSNYFCNGKFLIVCVYVRY